MKLTKEQQKELISDESVKEAFLNRDDIKNLPTEKQESLWQEHVIKLDKFRDFLSGLDSFVIKQ